MQHGHVSVVGDHMRVVIRKRGEGIMYKCNGIKPLTCRFIIIIDIFYFRVMLMSRVATR